LLASTVCYSIRVFDLAIISLAVDVRFPDVVDFEPLATPTRKPARGLNGGANAERAVRTYMILTITVQTTKTPVNATFTVYLFTTMYAKNTAWAKVRPRYHGQHPLVTTVESHLTVKSVANNPNKQQLAIHLVVFRIDV